MAKLYGPQYESLWREALLLPGHDDLLESLAVEVADHLGGTADSAREEMRRAFEQRGSLAADRFPDDPERLVEYYNDTLGIYVSAYWHSLVADRYALHAVAGLHAVQQLADGPRVFEFGHGIGSAALLFARHGLSVAAGDVSAHYRSFAAARAARRGIELKLVPLEERDPSRGAFDAVVSFDVLEHVPAPLAAVERMRDWLTPGGVLVLNVAFGRDPNNPEHLLARRLGFVDRIRGLGFERVPHPSLLVFYRRPVGRARAGLYRIQDAVLTATDDVVAKLPQVTPLAKTHRTPPL
jgi:SAM-dependent methyltransferase